MKIVVWYRQTAKENNVADSNRNTWSKRELERVRELFNLNYTDYQISVQLGIDAESPEFSGVIFPRTEKSITTRRRLLSLNRGQLTLAKQPKVADPVLSRALETVAPNQCRNVIGDVACTKTFKRKPGRQLLCDDCLAEMTRPASRKLA